MQLMKEEKVPYRAKLYDTAKNPSIPRKKNTPSPIGENHQGNSSANPQRL
jgi:hypothetical protein